MHPELGPGFDLWVGGGLSTNPMLAQKAGVWIPTEDVPDVWEAVASVFRDYGYRRLRSRARLKFLVADWGIDKFREVLENEYLGRTARAHALAALAGRPPRPHRRARAEGRRLLRRRRPDRRSGQRARRWSPLADLMDEFAVRGARLTPYQKIVLIGVRPDAVEPLLDRLDAIGLSARPSQWRQNTMACTGIEFCKLAIVDTKNRARDLVAELERRFPDLDTPITVNVNGCPNACARTQVADIGLKGQLVLDDHGNQVEGFQVHLGGATGLDANFGRKLRAHKVTSAELDDYVTAVVTAYLDEREDGESFADLGASAPTSRPCGASASWRPCS